MDPVPLNCRQWILVNLESREIILDAQVKVWSVGRSTVPVRRRARMVGGIANVVISICRKMFVEVKYNSNLVQRWKERKSVADVAEREILGPMTLKDTRVGFPDFYRNRYVESYLKVLVPSSLKDPNLLLVSQDNEIK